MCYSWLTFLLTFLAGRLTFLLTFSYMCSFCLLSAAAAAGAAAAACCFWLLAAAKCTTVPRDAPP